MTSTNLLLFGLSFLIFCSGGLACNPGWAEYGGKCFHVSMLNISDVRMARRYCMLYGGDLAYINTTDTFNFIRALPNYAGHYMTYWIKEDSQVAKSPEISLLPPNLCAYTYNQDIMYGDCDTKRLFICEKEQLTDMYCPTIDTTWYRYDSTCYKIMPMLGKYTESASYCSLLHSHLAILDDVDKEHHFGAVIIGQNKTFMVDAKYDNGTFKWSNGKDFQPSCETCIEHESGSLVPSCLGFKSDSEHPLHFSWIYLNCDSPNSFLCEMDARVMTVTSTTAQISSTTQKSATTTQKPVTTTQKPATTTRRPTTTQRHTTYTQRPTPYTQRPTPYFQRPTTYIRRYTIYTQRHTTSTPRHTTISPRHTTSTLTPLQCPIGYNWKTHEESGFCFWETTYETDKMNWHQARAFCKAYGGDLASYQNKEEESHGLGGAVGHYRGLWFGLERSQNNNFHWADGSPLSYTNWDSELHHESRSKFCGMHGPNEGKWELDYCGVRRWFICKSPLVRIPTVPDLNEFLTKTPCHVSSTSIYRHLWFLYEDHCYMVHEVPSYSWGMAKNFCNDNEAELASIHSFDETDFILLLASISSNTDYWIGLSSIGIGSPRTWSDKTPVDFLYWGDGYRPTEENGINSCVTFNKQRGFWQNEHCNRFLGVICKRRFNSSFELTTPQPTPLLPGNCEKGWYNLGNQCYKTFGEKWSKRVKWSEAKDNCESIGATLVSIHTKVEQDFLIDLLINLGSDAWIGLQSLNIGTTYEWSDDTSLDYVNWDVNEPVLSVDSDDDLFFGMSAAVQSNSCIKLSSDTDSMGKWKDVACSYRNAYICQKPKNVTITEPAEDLFVCSNIPGWSRLGSSCYGFFNTTVSWVEAQRKCMSFDADLVSFKNSAMSIFLKKRLSRKYLFFWTGIRSIGGNEYSFLNGQRLKYSNWLAGQPQKVSNLMDNCVAMNLNAEWIVRSCKETFPFVCEWNPGGYKTEGIIEKRHTCPNISEWDDIGTDTCYLFNLDHRVTWNDAISYCFRHGGHLASLHSTKEAELVRQHILDNTAASFVHIGLGKRKDGSYAWVDHTPFDYIQWDEDEPQEGGYECVQLFIRSGKWRSVECDHALRGFICSSTRDANIKASPMEDDTEEDVVGSKLAVGGFIGIAICLMVVFAIASVTAYYVCPFTRMRVRLLDSP